MQMMIWNGMRSRATVSGEPSSQGPRPRCLPGSAACPLWTLLWTTGVCLDWSVFGQGDGTLCHKCLSAGADLTGSRSMQDPQGWAWLHSGNLVFAFAVAQRIY